MHILNIQVEDSELDARFLVVRDRSQYDSLLPVTNAGLYIQLPGFVDARLMEFSNGNTKSYNSLSLGLSTGETLYELPDGLYTLTYSVAPNNQVSTVVYHYRTAIISRMLNSALLGLAVDTDEHDITPTGFKSLTAKDSVLIRAALLLEALKGPITTTDQLADANKVYTEIVRLLQLKTSI